MLWNSYGGRNALHDSRAKLAIEVVVVLEVAAELVVAE